MEIVELYFNIREKKQNFYQSFVLKTESKTSIFGFLIIENCSNKTKDYFEKIESFIKKHKKTAFPELLQNINDFIWRSPISNQEKLKFLIGLTKPCLNKDRFSFQISCISNFEILIDEKIALKNHFEKTTRFQKIHEFETSKNQLVWCLEQGLFEQLDTRNIFDGFIANFNPVKTLAEQIKSFFNNTEIKNLLGIGLVIRSTAPNITAIPKIQTSKNFKKIINYLKSISISEKFVIPLIFCIFVAISIPLFNYERKIQYNLIEHKIQNINQNIKLGDYFIRQGNNERAKNLFLESWNLIQETNQSFGSSKFPELKMMEKNSYETLLNLFNVKKIEKIEKVAQINPKEIVAEKLFCLKDNLVLLSNYQQKIFLPSEKKSLTDKFSIATSSSDSLILYDKDNNSIKILKFANSNLNTIETKKIEYEQQKEFGDFTSYLSNYYLLDKNSLMIWKGNINQEGFYPYINLNNMGLNFVPDDFKVNGSFWILNSKEKSIFQYRDGKLKKIDLKEIFPLILNPREIKTMPASKNIYLADILTKRIIAINKTDNSFNQFVFSELNGIRDFCVSEDENEIFILSENNIYKTNIPF